MSDKRVNSNVNRNRMHTYEDGSAVRKLNPLPKELTPEREVLPKRKLSSQMKENRRRATKVNRGYVLFLSAICAATVFVCVNFLQLKAELTTQSEKIATLETTLNKKKSENDAYHASVLASVNLEEIKAAALNQYGLKYPTKDQVVYFSTNDNSYVRQFEDVR